MTASAEPGKFPLLLLDTAGAEMGGCPGMWPLGCKAAFRSAGAYDSGGNYRWEPSPLLEPNVYYPWGCPRCFIS